MSESSVSTETSPSSVLVVDDDPLIREGLRELLDSYGFVVSGLAADGHEAVSLAERTTPEVVLMDLRMPGLDGIGATQLVKERLPWVQVIVLSAYDDASLRRDAANVGVYCYLVKGCPPDLLVEMVRRAAAYGREASGASRDVAASRARARPGT